MANAQTRNANINFTRRTASVVMMDLKFHGAPGEHSESVYLYAFTLFARLTRLIEEVERNYVVESFKEFGKARHATDSTT